MLINCSRSLEYRQRLILLKEIQFVQKGTAPSKFELGFQLFTMNYFCTVGFLTTQAIITELDLCIGDLLERLHFNVYSLYL